MTGPSTAASLNGRTREYRLLLALTLTTYLVLYGGLLAWTQGLPYVLDNNESFATLWHAQNMAEHDIRRSFWLTDESYGQNEDAHPFVHSHQGNFPRLFAWLIYVLGVRTIEAQIVVTTLTIGAFSMFLLFRFFALTVGPRFACVVGLVFMTDYLFYAQWQVVTYRVWHGFFLFGSLLCVHGVLRSPRRRWWLVATALLYLMLFYYELIFVAFVALFSALYAVLLGWRTPRWVLAFGVTQGLFGALSLMILILQLAGHLGLSGLREDLYLTYVARNFATQSPDFSNLSPWSLNDMQTMTSGAIPLDSELRRRLETFYDQHNLVFWWNLVDSRPLRRPVYMVASLFVWVFQFYTPLFVLLIGTLLTGWMLGGERPGLPGSRRPVNGHDRWLAGWRLGGEGLMFRSSIVVDRERAEQKPQTALRQPGQRDRAAVRRRTAAGNAAPGVRSGALPCLGLLALAVATFLLLTTVLRDEAYRGLPLSRDSFVGQVGVAQLGLLFAGVLAVTVGLARWLVGSWRGLTLLAPGRLFLASVLLLALTGWIRLQPGLYDQYYAPLWFGRISGQLPGWLARGLILLAAAVAVALTLAGRRAMLGRGHGVAMSGLGRYLACGVLAYLIVYYLAAGYVITGYMGRMSPLTVFVLDVLIALAVGIVGMVALRAVGAVRSQPWRQPRRRSRSRAGDAGTSTTVLQRASLLNGIAASLLLVGMVGYWAHLQRAYMEIIPANQFTFLRMFAEPPYRGASFAVSTYAAPLAYFTQGWAYFDPLISNGEVRLVNGTPQLMNDGETYLWLADRHQNPAYRTPDYYACITTPSFRTVVDRMTGREPRAGRCSTIAMAERARATNQEYMRFTFVASDASPADAWAIVRLNWDLLPYLQPFEGSSPAATVRATLSSEGLDRVIRVSYQFVNSNGQGERGTTVRLYRQQSDGSRVLVREEHDTLYIRVPADFSGAAVVSVTPGDGTHTGAEYFSQPVPVP